MEPGSEWQELPEAFWLPSFGHLLRERGCYVSELSIVPTSPEWEIFPTFFNWVDSLNHVREKWGLIVRDRKVAPTYT
jgi:hypothetical protein